MHCIVDAGGRMATVSCVIGCVELRHTDTKGTWVRNAIITGGSGGIGKAWVASSPGEATRSCCVRAARWR